MNSTESAVRRLLFISDLREMFPGIGQDAWYALLSSGEINGRKVRGKWATTLEAVDDWLDGIAKGDEGDEPAAGAPRMTN